MDHSYIKTREVQRCPSVFHGHIDHGYGKPVPPGVFITTPKKTPVPPGVITTPKKTGLKRGRDATTPTGKTPIQIKKRPGAPSHLTKEAWTPDEKVYIEKYIVNTPRGSDESLSCYWEKCANSLHENFPSSKRNGHACKSLAQRLLLAPVIASQTQQSDQTSSKPTYCCASTQTDLTLPVKSTGLNTSEHREGEWIFITPKKDLKEGASEGATMLNSAALKRLRRFGNLSAKERAHLIDLLCSSDSSHIAQSIMDSSLGEELKCMMLYDIEIEARDCTSSSSVLHQTTYTDLAEFQWDSVVTELSERQPFLLDVLLAVALPTGKIGHNKATEALRPVIGFIYGVLMKQRFHELSQVQKVITMSLANEQTHQKVYDRLQPLGVTLSHSTMLETMTTISGSFNNQIINEVKNGKHFRIVGDNVNFRVGVTHERQNHISRMEHWFGSAAIVQNVKFEDYSKVAPQCNLQQLEAEFFVMNDDDWRVVENDLILLVSKILLEFLPWFKPAKKDLIDNLSSDMPEQMKSKNKVIPLPVMKKNEQKYADVVDILDSYQTMCESVYETANIPLPSIHIGGDQLTRDRFYGAKRLRAAALTPSDRLENLSPITFELFHLQMTLLSALFKILYNKSNIEPFTLHSQKIRLMRQDADGEDVKNHFNSCRELADSFTRAYVVEAACSILGLTDLKDKPKDHSEITTEEMKDRLLNLSKQIVSLAVTESQRHLKMDEAINDNDTVTCYGKVTLEMGLLFLNLADVIKSPSRIRMLSLMKYIMLVLKGHNNQSKYALEILRFLCHQLAMLSEKTAHESFYGLFVNTGKTNIPTDLQMEYIVRLTKSHLKAMCSNVTQSSIMKRSSAFFGMEEIGSNYDMETHVIHRAQRHKRLSSFDDELKIIRDLRKVKPFLHVENRKIPSQNKVPQNPITKLDMDHLLSWMDQHKLLLYYEL